MSTGSSSSFQAAVLASSTSDSLSQSLAAAAAKGTALSSAAYFRRIPHGRFLTGNTNVTYDISERQDGEEQPELEVTTVTHYASDNILEHRQQIAVNQDYICYALKQGHLRVLHKSSTGRCLAKGHLPSTVITDLRFFSSTSNFLASAGKDGQVIVWELAGEDEDTTTSTQVAVLKFADFDQDEGHSLHISWHPLHPTILAACYGPHVMICNLDELKQEGALAHVVESESMPHGIVDLESMGAKVSAVAFSRDGTLLAAGTMEGKVHVWDYPVVEGKKVSFDAHRNEGVGTVAWLPSSTNRLLLTANDRNQELKLWEFSDEPQNLQTVSFMSEAGLDAFFNRVVLEDTSRLVILSNALHASLFTLHLGCEAADGQQSGFDYLAEFRLGLPVVSLCTFTSRTQDGQAGPIQMYCIQTSAIQQYHLYPELCSPSPPTEALRDQSAHPNPWLAEAGPPRESVVSTVPPVARPVPSTSQPENGKVDSPPGTAAPEVSVASTGLPISDDVAAPSWQAVEEAVTPSAPPQPRLLTPTGLLNSAMAAASRTASGASSLSVDAALATSQPPSSAFAMDMTSPRPESIPLPDACIAPVPAPEVDISPAPAVTPAAVQSQADVQQAEAVAPLPAGDRVAPSPAKPSKRNKQSLNAASVAPTQAGTVGAPEPSAAVGAEAGQGMSSGEIMQKMAEMQKKLHQSIVQSSKDSQRALREELKREATRLEALYKQEVEAVRKIVQEEREGLLAHEHMRLRELLGHLSASINRDLVEKIQDAMQREVGAERNVLRQAITAAVDTAFSARLSKDLPVLLQAAAEKALPAALAQPLQSMFKKNFEELLIPAFEAACKNMFHQVQVTFSAGLSEHLQAANGASTATAASLSASLARVDGILGRSEALAEKLVTGVAEAGHLLHDRAANGTLGRTGSSSTSADPTIKLGELLHAQRYQEAFELALDLANTDVVNWLCKKLDPEALFMTEPLPLSQNVILALLQQLGAELDEEVDLKLKWIKAAAVVVNPHDPVLKEHVQPILQQVLSLLQARMNACKDPKQVNECRIVMHVLNSILHQCRGR